MTSRNSPVKPPTNSTSCDDRSARGRHPRHLGFIANDSGGQLETSLIPEELATTVVTLAELTRVCSRRQPPRFGRGDVARLDAVADMNALPVAEEAADFGRQLR